MAILKENGLSHTIERIVNLLKGKSNAGHKHTKSDITDFPTLGTASSKDVPSSGNASTTQVVMGNDTRLSDARKASDVSAWAKASTKPTYTKSEVGLTNVDNTSDTSKPVSTAQQTAIDTAYTNANKYTDKKVAELIGSAPETMDTLEEVAAAIQKNKDVETALNEAIGKKANQTELDTHTGNSTIHITASERTNWNAAKTHADSAHARTDATKVEKSTTNGNIKINGTETTVYTHPSGTNPHGTTKSDVGLGNVDNTADSEKSVKYATSAGSASSVTWNNVSGKPSTYSPSSHTHSIANITNLQNILDDKAASNHTHSYLPLSGGTVTGDVTVTGILKGENDGHTNHALLLGHNAQDYMNFYEYGGLFQFYKSQSGTDTLLGKISVDGWEGKVNGHTVNSDVPSGAKFTDTVYTHPTTSGNKHIPGGGSSGQILKWSADGTATWGNEESASLATTTSNGLMSSTQFKNLSNLISTSVTAMGTKMPSSYGRILKLSSPINGSGNDAYGIGIDTSGRLYTYFGNNGSTTAAWKTLLLKSDMSLSNIYITSLSLGSMTLKGNWDGDAPQTTVTSNGNSIPLCIIPKSSGSADVCWIDCYIDSNNRTKVRLKNTVSGDKTFTPSVYVIYKTRLS